MAWEQVEPTPPHITYLVLTSFLITYCLFTTFIRNRLHLSEPPIALLFGIILGPLRAWLAHTQSLRATNGPDWASDDGDGIGGWGWGDDIVQEASESHCRDSGVLPSVWSCQRYYASRHWKSISHASRPRDDLRLDRVRGLRGPHLPHRSSPPPRSWPRALHPPTRSLRPVF